jgi:hypothetical protein
MESAMADINPVKPTIKDAIVEKVRLLISPIFVDSRVVRAWLPRLSKKVISCRSICSNAVTRARNMNLSEHMASEAPRRAEAMLVTTAKATNSAAQRSTLVRKRQLLVSFKLKVVTAWR